MAVPSGYIIAEDGRKERAIRRKPVWISTPEKGEGGDYKRVRYAEAYRRNSYGRQSAFKGNGNKGKVPGAY